MTAPSPPSTASHAEQLLLRGQAAAPPGPVDVAGMYLMHHAFRRDLDLFTAATAATPIEDRECWTRLNRRWRLFSSTLHKHHRGEDSGLWPLLLERARGGEPATVLAAMSAEHQHIDPLLHACGSEFTALARTGDAQVRRDLAGHIAELRDLLQAHLAHEEHDAMALVQAHLTQHDWERLDKEHFALDPASKATVKPSLGRVRQCGGSGAGPAHPGPCRSARAAGRRWPRPVRCRCRNRRRSWPHAVHR
ncbi:hemerythrin domain-containing protein [Nonomuraea basaltis]|nr:hemerythrin domain-containing protein [Nonomuraea basaltis]